MYDNPSAPAFIPEPDLVLLQNQSILPPVYELSSPQAISTARLTNFASTAARTPKREIDEDAAMGLANTANDKDQVYEWMKGTDG